MFHGYFAKPICYLSYKNYDDLCVGRVKNKFPRDDVVAVYQSLVNFLVSDQKIFRKEQNYGFLSTNRAAAVC